MARKEARASARMVEASQTWLRVKSLGSNPKLERKGVEGLGFRV